MTAEYVRTHGLFLEAVFYPDKPLLIEKVAHRVAPYIEVPPEGEYNHLIALDIDNYAELILSVGNSPIGRLWGILTEYDYLESDSFTYDGKTETLKYKNGQISTPVFRQSAELKRAIRASGVVRCLR